MAGACCCLASAAAQQVPAQAPSRSPAAVVHAIIAADNRRDLAAVMELYAPDAELWPAGESPVRGASAIEARYSKIFAANRPELRASVDRVRDAGDWALIEGEIQGAVFPIAGDEPRAVDDKYLMVLERSSAGVWKIVRLMWSSNGPPEMRRSSPKGRPRNDPMGRGRRAR